MKNFIENLKFVGCVALCVLVIIASIVLSFVKFVIVL